MSLHVLCRQDSCLLEALVNLFFTPFCCCFEMENCDSVTFVQIFLPLWGPEQLKVRVFFCMCKSDVVRSQSVIYLLLRNQSRFLNEDR